MLPTRFIAGDTFSFSATLSDYPAGDGWVLQLRFVPRTAGASIDVTCSASGNDHVATVAAAVTAAWAAGEYSATAWAELGAVKTTVETGSFTVLADPREAATLDNRSAAEVALAAAEAALAAWSPTVRRYRINGREMEFNAASEILPVISYWRSKVQNEQAVAARQAGRADPRKTVGRVGRA